MQVSKLLILCCLALLAAVLYVATPAMALEHPWEEGENTGSGNTDNTGPTGPFPSDDTTSVPFLVSGTQGTVLWWFQLFLDPTNDFQIAQTSSPAVPADTRRAIPEVESSKNSSMK